MRSLHIKWHGLIYCFKNIPGLLSEERLEQDKSGSREMS